MRILKFKLKELKFSNPRKEKPLNKELKMLFFQKLFFLSSTKRLKTDFFDILIILIIYPNILKVIFLMKK